LVQQKFFPEDGLVGRIRIPATRIFASVDEPAVEGGVAAGHTVMSRLMRERKAGSSPAEGMDAPFVVEEPEGCSGTSG
jgi:hypothetical protein